MRVHESEGDVLHSFSECNIWDLPDRREKMLPSLEIGKICFEATGFLVALSELTGAHFYY